jgi:hypothetical protein
MPWQVGLNGQMVWSNEGQGNVSLPPSGPQQPQDWSRLDAYDQRARELNGGQLDPEHARLLREEGTRRQDFTLPGMEQHLANQAAARQQQGEAANHLASVMRGENSMAAEQIRQGQDRALSQQRALQASARPGMQAAAARGASQNASRIGMDALGMGTMAGIAERNAAANALTGALGGMRGADVGLIGMGQQGQQAYQQNALQRYLQQQQLEAQDDPFKTIMGTLGGLGSQFIPLLGGKGGK